MANRLPHPDLHNPEIQANFEFIEGQLSLFVLADPVISAEVGGTKLKKIAVKDSLGKVIGFIPIYSA